MMDPTRELRPGISVHMMVLNPPLDRMAALVVYLMPHVQEFVIIDTGSPDEVVLTMESWNYPTGVPVRVYRETFVDFSTTRNLGLARHEFEWTLGLDPDELPSFEMLQHIKRVTSPEGMAEAPHAAGYVYWTLNWWNGLKGPEQDYHWHTRLWRTFNSFLQRPVHELVVVSGNPELGVRNTPMLPHAPKQAYLIHSKGAEEIEKADQLYAQMGEVSR